TVPNAANADPRRIPYRITPAGRARFERWLRAPLSAETMREWILFADRVPADVRDDLLARRREDLDIRRRLLERKQGDVAARRRAEYDPSAALVADALRETIAEAALVEHVLALLQRRECPPKGHRSDRKQKSARRVRQRGDRETRRPGAPDTTPSPHAGGGRRA